LNRNSPRQIFNILLFACFVLSVQVISAAESTNLEKLIKAIRHEQNEAVIKTLITAGDNEPEEYRSTYALCRLWLLERDTTGDSGQKFMEARETFHEKWPNSEYHNFIEYMYARWLIRNDQSIKAADKLLDLLNQKNEELLIKRSTALLNDLFSFDLGVSGADALLLKRIDRVSRDYLENWSGGRFINRSFGVVLPLKGVDSAAGKEMLRGIELGIQLESSPDLQQNWKMEIFDCESDPVLAQLQMKKLSARTNLDFIISLGEPEYVAAAGFGSKTPIVFPWFGGEEFAEIDAALFRLNVPNDITSGAMATLVCDSLNMNSVIAIAPATRHGKHMVEELNQILIQKNPFIEFGPPQWYFPGAQDMRRQLENVAVFDAAFDSSSCIITFMDSAEMEVFLPQLAYADPQGIVIGGAEFIEHADIPELKSLDGQLLILSDWYSPDGHQRWSAMEKEFNRLESRQPVLANKVGYESARLLMRCGDAAALANRSYRASLENLQLPSSFGGRFMMFNRANSHLLLLSYYSRRFHVLGGISPMLEQN
jgi:hypothetical protein